MKKKTFSKRGASLQSNNNIFSGLNRFVAALNRTVSAPNRTVSALNRTVSAANRTVSALTRTVSAILLASLVGFPAYAQSKTHTEVIQVQPATTYYTTRVEKVTNTTKYPKYKPPTPPASKQQIFQHVIPDKPPTLLTGQVGEDDDLDDGINRGVGPVADDLLKQSARLGEVRKVHLEGDVFRKWMTKNWPKLDVTQLKPFNTVVVKGRYDHAERVLEYCHIPYQTADSSNIANKLRQATLLVIDCPGELSDGAIDVVRSFIISGGYVLTTDWALSGTLQRACPGFVYFDGAYSKSEVVDGTVVTPDNNLVANAPSPAPWKLDDKSELVKPGARKSLQVLARSKSLTYEDTVGLGVLALTFDYGRGHVLHQIGHVDNNSDLANNAVLPDPSPQVVISLRQVISLNFIANALMHR
ncbi:MAG TPA: hypothetical protein V6C76_10515 [Drouetiella sp.]